MNNINNVILCSQVTSKFVEKKVLLHHRPDLILDIIIYTSLLILFVVHYIHFGHPAISLNDTIDSNRGYIYLLPGFYRFL